VSRDRFFKSHQFGYPYNWSKRIVYHAQNFLELHAVNVKEKVRVV
jgi:hypothetical protein